MRSREEHALAARTGAGQHQSDEHEAGQTLRGGHFLYGVGDEWLRLVEAGGRLAPSAAVWGNNKLGNATATLVAPTAVAGNGARGSEGGRLSRAAEGHTPVIFLPHRAPILLMRAASGAFYSQPC
jgi:hypothetical protein